MSNWTIKRTVETEVDGVLTETWVEDHVFDDGYPEHSHEGALIAHDHIVQLRAEHGGAWATERPFPPQPLVEMLPLPDEGG